VAVVSVGGSPGELTRFGSLQAAAGLGGVEVQIFIRSDETAAAIGRLALSRQPGPAARLGDGMVPNEASESDPDFLPLTDSIDCTEALQFVCDGLTIQCATRGSLPGSVGSTTPGLAGEWSRIGPQTEHYAGVLRSNPRFLYDDVRLSELLFTIDPSIPEASTWGLAAILMNLAAKLSGAAKDATAPILYMQSPVAPFRAVPKPGRADGSLERPREAAGVVLRAAVGVDAKFPDRRIALEWSMSKFSADHGIGMEVRDRRPGKVRGDWFSVVKHEADQIRTYAEDLAGNDVDTQVAGVRPVTIVGPGRIGSTATCLALLNSLGAGLCGVSITAAQDIALINLILPDRGVGPKESLERAGPAQRVADHQDLELGLRAVAQTALPTTDRRTSEVSDLEEEAADYVLVAGRRRLHKKQRSPQGVQRRSRWAIWSSWDVPQRLVTFQMITRCLLEALTVEVETSGGARVQPQLLYARSRTVGTARLRGRSKIAVETMPVPPELSVQQYLDELCSRVEARARELLIRRLSQDVGSGGISPNRAGALLGDVRVGWRERWLGKGSPIL
jgi:hypothetical protein